MNESIEVNIAKRLVSYYNLSPPINILKLAKEHAIVIEHHDLPVDIDGASFNLNKKNATIIINTSKPFFRRQFTLAHELGHVLIPSHKGDIVDDTIDKYTTWFEEWEANRFASELLLPEQWIRDCIASEKSIPKLVSKVSNDAKVSVAASVLRVINLLKPGYIMAEFSNKGVVLNSNRSPKSFTQQLTRGTIPSQKEIFKLAEEQWKLTRQNGNYYVWWKMPDSIQLSTTISNRTWQQILREILDDMAKKGFDIKWGMSSINGIVGSANSDAKGFNHSEFKSALIQKFHSRAQGTPFYSEFIKDHRFEEFIDNRIQGLFSGKTNSP